jgi:hypothetical protein
VNGEFRLLDARSQAANAPRVASVTPEVVPEPLVGTVTEW